MTIQFTRIEDNSYNFAEGTYKASIAKIDIVQMENEKSLSFTWLILEPTAFRGREKWENFTLVEDMSKINSDELRERRAKEQEKFNVFWSQMSDSESGILTDEEIKKILYKEAMIEMKKFSAPDGRTVTYIRKRKPIQILKKEQEPKKNANLIDDSSVPFEL